MSDDDMIRKGDVLALFGDYRTAMLTDRSIAALPAVQVGVKALEWEERGTDFWRAQGIDRVYEIVALADGRFFLTNGPRLSDYPTLEAAKAAAQADYEARIRSALTVQPAPGHAPDVAALGPDVDGFGALIFEAKVEAEKAMRKFPQPNYVISKIAEEAGEVVKAAIHCAEGRETADNLCGEMKQVIAMLYRLWIEGDQVHGLPPVRATLAALEARHG